MNNNTSCIEKENNCLSSLRLFFHIHKKLATISSCFRVNFLLAVFFFIGFIIVKRHRSFSFKYIHMYSFIHTDCLFSFQYDEWKYRFHSLLLSLSLSLFGLFNKLIHNCLSCNLEQIYIKIFLHIILVLV